MGIRIDQNKCIQCGECVEICPEDVLELEGETVTVRYPQE